MSFFKKYIYKRRPRKPIFVVVPSLFNSSSAEIIKLAENYHFHPVLAKGKVTITLPGESGKQQQDWLSLFFFQLGYIQQTKTLNP